MSTDKQIIDWLQAHDVRVTVYNGGKGEWEIHWFDTLEPEKNCKTCGHHESGGSWPAARGKTLRKAVIAAMKAEREEK